MNNSATKANNFLASRPPVIDIIGMTLLMILAVTIFYMQEQKSTVAKGWVIHTHEVTEHIQAFFNLMANAELSQRGYLLTDNVGYLETYQAMTGDSATHSSVEAIEPSSLIAKELGVLRNLTSDNAVQQRNLDIMDKIVSEKLSYMHSVLKLYDSQGLNAVIPELRSLRGKQMFDHIHNKVDEMVAEENRLLTIRNENDATSLKRNDQLIFAGIGTFYSGIVLFILLAAHQRKRVRKMEGEVYRQAQDVLHYTKALERSNKELDDFAYVASHDLKAPLRVIDNASKWLEEDLQEHLTDETRESMRLLRGRVKRMEKLLDDMLEYSQIGRKINEDDAEIIAGNELMDNILALLSSPQGFEVKVSDRFANIHVSRMPLQQILMNLISNAIKHHDKKTGIIEITVADRDGMYEFAVKDDGPGIPAQFHDQIFKMFQTLKPRDQVEGSGMGLAMVRKHIEVSGGTLTLESSEGKGSTFRFTWPKNQPTKGDT